MTSWSRLPAWLVGVAAACSPPAPLGSLPPNSFAFGVFGDGPYSPWEQGRFRRVLEEVSQTDLAWLLHVGDILWYPCSEDAYRERLDQLNGVNLPVIYTPGDNEWTDCHEDRQGRHDPLDRLTTLRTVFFRDPGRSLGRHPLALVSQAADSGFGEFVENARWLRGGFVFSTIHLVGSSNGLDPFPERTPAHDAEVTRRTAAAVAWLDQAFATARDSSAKGVVLVLHGDMGLDPEIGPRDGYDPFIVRLKHHVARFPEAVLLIHGDSHIQRVDQPLTDGNGRVYPNFTRLETFGSPDIGWVRVVIDTVAVRITSYEPRLMRAWW